jgi:hypothetical protein
MILHHLTRIKIMPFYSAHTTKQHNLTNHFRTDTPSISAQSVSQFKRTFNSLALHLLFVLYYDGRLQSAPNNW